MSSYGKIYNDLKLFSYMVCQDCHCECVHKSQSQYICIKCNEIYVPDKKYRVYWLFEHVTNYISTLDDSDAKKAIKIVLSKVFKCPDLEVYNQELIDNHLCGIRNRYC